MYLGVGVPWAGCARDPGIILFVFILIFSSFLFLFVFLCFSQGRPRDGVLESLGF